MEENKNLSPEQSGIPPEQSPRNDVVDEPPISALDEKISSECETAASQKFDTLNFKPETSPMEVHHHGHVHEKKKWKEYVFQFLMLFLAVFCGFLAEYQLEHKIERDKERIYVQNLLEDLKADTAIYSEYTRNNKILFESIDTLIQLVKTPERKKNIAKLAFAARMILPKYKALYTTDRSHEEMKSSGALRLIRNKQVANSVSLYYYSVVDLKKYNDAAYTWGSDFGKQMGKIFDAGLLLKIIKEKKEQPAVSSDLLTEDRIALNELATSAQYLYGAFLLAEKIGSERKIAAQKLIALIKDEYNLQNE